MIEPVTTVTPDYIHPALHGSLYWTKELHLDPRNTKVHSDRSLETIASSLQMFGQDKPIIVRRQTGVIIAGNGTYQAATQILKWDVIACVLTDMTEAQARARAIADNRTSEVGSSYDNTELLRQIEEIQAAEIDMDSLGFAPVDVDKIRSIVESAQAENNSAAGGGNGGGDEPPAFGTPVLVTEEQRQVFELARAKVFEQTGADEESMSDGRALELICGDFIAGVP